MGRSVSTAGSPLDRATGPLRAFTLKIATFLSISGIVIGLAAVGFVYVALVLAGVSPSWLTLTCAFCLCVPIYAYDYSRDSPFRLAIVFVTLPPAVLLGLLLWKQNWLALAWALALVLLGLTYGNVFKPLSTKLPGFKDLYVAAMWTFLLPFAMACEREPWTGSMSLAALFLFLLFLFDVSACDVKDMKEDAEKGFRTLVVFLGHKAFFAFMHLVNVFTGILIVFGILATYFPAYALVLVMSVPYVYFYLRGVSKHGGGRLYATYVIDAHFCWLAVALLIVRWLLL